MEIYKTIVGDIYVRNEYDKEVVHEVIGNREYERWGDIKMYPAYTVIDAGAHIGAFTRLALAYQCQVIAIEPDDENFDMLLKNTEGYAVKLVHGLLWNGKEVRFLKDKKRGELNKVDSKGKLMPSVKLDSLVEHFKLKQIDLLKMDIEGSEYEVLYNFKHLDIVKQITMEWHYGSTKMAELIIFLEKHNFEVVWSAGNGQWGKLQIKHL